MPGHPLIFSFWRAVFVWEFSFPLLLSFTYRIFIYVYIFLFCTLVKRIIKLNLNYLTLTNTPPPPPPLKLNLFEDLNPPLASVSAFRKMKIYTFVLGVIKSTAFTQQIPAIALKYLFALPAFLCIQMSYFHGLTRKEGERETSKWKTKLRENLTWNYGNAESIACEKTPGGAGRGTRDRPSPFLSPPLSVYSRLIATLFPGSLPCLSGREGNNPGNEVGFIALSSS